MSRKRENLARKFLENCHENNLVGVTKSMSRGVDVNTVSEDGQWTGLTIAADKNYQELLEILLSHPDIKVNNTVTIAITFTAEQQRIKKKRSVSGQL